MNLRTIVSVAAKRVGSVYIHHDRRCERRATVTGNREQLEEPVAAAGDVLFGLQEDVYVCNNVSTPHVLSAESMYAQ